ncbi:MAG: 8-oxo-dGTP diphosphatase [Clostridium sp.]|uniref:8-oxo-dGTP diphosphatase n=1 Tax=Clostridium sp. TaxID=1506 RepID=UPI002A8C411A|nr:8-oxo-dGTP diphosphatase [Clostridium sp.]MDY5096647.1 8-oxo-dGTP diphosphatase [Clostridium sp.]
MSRNEKAVFTNMCMIYDKKKILVQNRVNPKWPGITFPGGHVERGESFVASVIREIFEETGLTIENPILCGIKQFQDKEDNRYVVLFFKTDKYSGELKSSDEGEVFWIDRNDLSDYDLAEDFDDMLKIFESDSLSEFYYIKEKDKWEKNIY